MDLGLQGKTAIITGASKGIGKAIAEVLAEEGCDLHLVSRTEADLNAVRDDLSQRFGAETTVQALDLAKPEAVQALSDAAGDADILINNAGAIPGGDLAKLNDDDIKEGWQLKVFGTVGLVRHFYPRMCERGNGVINVIGMAGERGRSAYIAGSMGNAALMQMSRTIGAESMNHGVRVLGVNPGPTQTERFTLLAKANAEKQFGDAERWRETMGGLPGGRGGLSEELAAVTAFMASPRASWVSGTVIMVDGGQHSRPPA
jgi:3-oxoacyl-[acyl-carrier protein] reductase